ncbi:MAG: peptide chain release factor N(5)-glutamine methyltransferase [Deltaproteobacteria bacterium]|nr:peptide chain release factor N(5)-glutamine methyltransferase [Deltaproteobacteria bacterium]
MTELWTSLKLIQWTASYFEKKGIPNPRLDAELLLAHVLKCPRINLYTDHDKKVSEKDLAHFKSLIERRTTREPLQYIVGTTEFWGLKFHVTPEVLIPRPETELLVEQVMNIVGQTQGSAPTMQILDIGTGSGCIAIALAKNLAQAKVTATDKSPEALEVARKNAKFHGVEDRISFILSDIAPWKSFTAEGRSFDVIISNPPYIPSSEIPDLQSEVSQFEPRQALDGGTDGMTIIQSILQEAPHFLKENGFLLMEIGEAQAQKIREGGFTTPSLSLNRIVKDYNGIERVITFVRSIGDTKPEPGVAGRKDR